jgi:hypothetical protein
LGLSKALQGRGGHREIDIMLFMSLTVSALLLFAANWFVFRARKPVGKAVWLCLTFTFAPFFAMCILPPVAIQSLLLAGAVGIWRVSRRGPRFFLRLSGAATLAAYACAAWLAWQSEHEYARLRSIYPFESMEQRVPAPKHEAHAALLVGAPAQRLDRLEQAVQSESGDYREWQLRQLHEDALGLFINSPGFGVARMMRPSEMGLKIGVRRELVPSQPGPRITSVWSPGEFVKLSAGYETWLGLLLENSVLDFVFPRAWGYQKDRRHVAGYLSHRFSRVPDPIDRWEMHTPTPESTEVSEPKARWKVQTLDLVGLLRHDEPVVYVSDHLPSMDELRGAATRPVDKFETLGLIALRHGEDLFVSRDGESLRMLGAISSTKQCVACHGGERGDLLGAFSYTLRCDEK